MEIKQSLEILKDHQKWRRAEGEYTSVGVKSKYTPTHLGIAIDTLIKEIEEKT